MSESPQPIIVRINVKALMFWCCLTTFIVNLFDPLKPTVTTVELGLHLFTTFMIWIGILLTLAAIKNISFKTSAVVSVGMLLGLCSLSSALLASIVRALI